MEKTKTFYTPHPLPSKTNDKILFDERRYILPAVWVKWENPATRSNKNTYYYFTVSNIKCGDFPTTSKFENEFQVLNELWFFTFSLNLLYCYITFFLDRFQQTTKFEPCCHIKASISNDFEPRFWRVNNGCFSLWAFIKQDKDL